MSLLGAANVEEMQLEACFLSKLVVAVPANWTWGGAGTADVLALHPLWEEAAHPRIAEVQGVTCCFCPVKNGFAQADKSRL